LILTKYNIDNFAVNIAEEKFDNLPLPCMVQVSMKAHLKNTELKKRWKNYYKKFNPKMIVQSF